MQATFEDELVEDALAKRHSLTCEAVQIGAQVCSSYLLLLSHQPYQLMLVHCCGSMSHTQ